MHKGITRGGIAKTHFEAPPRSESFQGGYRNQLSHPSCQLVLSTPIRSLVRSPVHSFSPALLLHIVAAETCFLMALACFHVVAVVVAAAEHQFIQFML